MSKFSVDLEFTPNPNTLKYTVNTDFFESGAFNFRDVASAKGKAPLAERLFQIPGIGAVMIAKNFVTITLTDHDSLTELNENVIKTVTAFLEEGNQKAVDLEAMKKELEAQRAQLGDIEQKIVEILDNEIRPSVAMDGGDITFEKFQDGIVFLHMKGSCAGCPSSTATLKMGIENRLKEVIPEVQEVVAV